LPLSAGQPFCGRFVIGALALAHVGDPRRHHSPLALIEMAALQVLRNDIGKRIAVQFGMEVRQPWRDPGGHAGAIAVTAVENLAAKDRYLLALAVDLHVGDKIVEVGAAETGSPADGKGVRSCTPLPEGAYARSRPLLDPAHDLAITEKVASADNSRLLAGRHHVAELDRLREFQRRVVDHPPQLHVGNIAQYSARLLGGDQPYVVESGRCDACEAAGSLDDTAAARALRST
jgi:hypothetical protein